MGVHAWVMNRLPMACIDDDAAADDDEGRGGIMHRLYARVGMSPAQIYSSSWLQCTAGLCTYLSVNVRCLGELRSLLALVNYGR